MPVKYPKTHREWSVHVWQSGLLAAPNVEQIVAPRITVKVLAAAIVLMIAVPPPAAANRSTIRSLDTCPTFSMLCEWTGGYSLRHEFETDQVRGRNESLLPAPWSIGLLQFVPAGTIPSVQVDRIEVRDVQTDKTIVIAGLEGGTVLDFGIKAFLRASYSSGAFDLSRHTEDGKWKGGWTELALTPLAEGGGLRTAYTAISCFPDTEGVLP